MSTEFQMAIRFAAEHWPKVMNLQEVLLNDWVRRGGPTRRFSDVWRMLTGGDSGTGLECATPDKRITVSPLERHSVAAVGAYSVPGHLEIGTGGVGLGTGHGRSGDNQTRGESLASPSPAPQAPVGDGDPPKYSYKGVKRILCDLCRLDADTGLRDGHWFHIVNGKEVPCLAEQWKIRSNVGGKENPT